MNFKYLQIRCVCDISTPPPPLRCTNYEDSTHGGIIYIGAEQKNDALKLKNAPKQIINNEYKISFCIPQGWSYVDKKNDNDNINNINGLTRFFFDETGRPKILLTLSPHWDWNNWIKGLKWTVGEREYSCVDVKINPIYLSTTLERVFAVQQEERLI